MMLGYSSGAGSLARRDESEQDLAAEFTLVITTVAFQCILYGIHFILVLFALYLLGSTGFGKLTRAKVVLMLATLLMFTVATIYAVLVLEIVVVFQTSDSSSYGPRTVKRQIAILYIAGINYVCSDAILIWRAFVLWNHKWIVIILPVILAIGSLVTALASALHTYVPSLGGQDSYVFVPATNPLLMASWGLTFAANVVATTLMAIKAWKYRQSFATAQNVRAKSKSFLTPSGVIMLIVESGSVYCVFWFLLILTNAKASETSLAGRRFSTLGTVLQDASVQIAGIYPIVLIVIVALQRSVVDIVNGPTPPLPTFNAASNPRHTLSIGMTPISPSSRRQKQTTQGSVVIIGFPEGHHVGNESNSTSNDIQPEERRFRTTSMGSEKPLTETLALGEHQGLLGESTEGATCRTSAARRGGWRLRRTRSSSLPPQSTSKNMR